jgi:hypothetical protein
MNRAGASVKAGHASLLLSLRREREHPGGGRPGGMCRWAAVAENEGVNPPVDRAGQALRRRHVARFERLLPEDVARIDWSWDQVRAERLRALREVLSVAVQRSPWHRERLAGLDAAHVSEADVGRCR